MTHKPPPPRPDSPRAADQALGSGGGAVSSSGGRRLSRAEFATEFAASSRALWCIAAAILGDRTRAEDVVQDAAFAALGKLDEFEPGTSFLAWMGRFVRYTALNEARRQRIRSVAPLDGVDAAVGAEPAGVAADRAVSVIGGLATGQVEFDDQVMRALRQLDEVARACLLLRTVHDMPYRQIAMVLDVPEGTAMSHVHRARLAMRQSLQQSTGTEGRSA